MKILEPKAEYWPQTGMYEHIANIASVCYHSPKKEGEKAKKMVEGLIKRNHISPTRHCSMYFIVDGEKYSGENWDTFNYLWRNCRFDENPYIKVYLADTVDSEKFYIATNYNYLLDNNALYIILDPYQVTPEEFMKECPELMRFTFCLTTQISTSRELNRKSPNNIMEESTRYILYAEDGKAEPAIVRPHWMTQEEAVKWSDKQLCYEYDTDWDYEKGGILANYMLATQEAFNRYIRLTKELHMKQEDARGILPLDTKTTVIYTYSVKEWSDIFKLRYLDMTGKAHPNCKVIMGLVLKEFNKLGYRLNDKGDLVYDRKFNLGI